MNSSNLIDRYIKPLRFNLAMNHTKAKIQLSIVHRTISWSRSKFRWIQPLLLSERAWKPYAVFFKSSNALTLHLWSRNHSMSQTQWSRLRRSYDSHEWKAYRHPKTNRSEPEGCPCDALSRTVAYFIRLRLSSMVLYAQTWHNYFFQCLIQHIGLA